MKTSFGSKIFDTLNVIFLALFTIVCIYPVLYIVFASFSNANDLMAYTGVILKPVGFSTEAYKVVLGDARIWMGYRNTIFYVAVGTTYNMIMTCLCSYALSRKNFFWKKYLLAMIVVTMFFGGGLIPSFLLVKWLGLLDTVWALIIPGAISTWNMIIIRTAFAGIPDSLEEAAKIDGADDFYILWKILLPLCVPTLVVIALFYGVGHWNSWFGAMIYLKSRALFPLQLYLREILIANQTVITGDFNPEGNYAIQETLKYATIIVASVPIFCAYPFLQKYFVKGIMIGSIKG